MTQPKYKTWQFWTVVLLTLIGLAGASDAVNTGSQLQHVLSWIVTMVGTLAGVHGWVPPAQD